MAITPLKKTPTQFTQLTFSDLDFKTQRFEFRDELGKQTVAESISRWFAELSVGCKNTAKSYRKSMNRLEHVGAIVIVYSNGRAATLNDFREIPHERVIDMIKICEDWSESTRQARVAAYISYTKWLSRQSEGWIREAKAKASGANKTFYKIRDKVATNALSVQDVYRLLDAISGVNHRDGLIARAIFGGARRISEVLDLTLSDVDFETGLITFTVSKSRGVIRKVGVTYSKSFINELKKYIDSTAVKRASSDLVFVTCSGKRVHPSRLGIAMNKAVKEMRNKWTQGKPTPHTLRTSWITHARSQGFGVDDISEVTGQTMETVKSYDKRGLQNNMSRKLQMI